MEPSTQSEMPPLDAECSIELIQELSINDLNDLCDATDAAIKGGGGFGWLELPAREILERYWQGVVVMPLRYLLVARLDGVICGTCQLIKPVAQNEAQKHIMQLTTHFISPWARGHKLATKLLSAAEELALKEGSTVINLDVRETQIAAISLYESHGYTRYGVHPYYAKIKGEMVKGFHYTKCLEIDSNA
jgi:ribosomal protein S18 acetylase RimI-like enzyme